MQREEKREEITLLAIALAEADGLSPVQLQKTVFLFQELLLTDVGISERYQFIPHNYGPFCSDIYSDAILLSCDSLITIDKENGRSYNSYHITPSGSKKAEGILKSWDESNVEYASNIVKWVKQQTFRSLVSTIYKNWPKYKEKSIFME